MRFVFWPQTGCIGTKPSALSGPQIPAILESDGLFRTRGEIFRYKRKAGVDSEDELTDIDDDDPNRYLDMDDIEEFPSPPEPKPKSAFSSALSAAVVAAGGGGLFVGTKPKISAGGFLPARSQLGSSGSGSVRSQFKKPRMRSEEDEAEHDSTSRGNGLIGPDYEILAKIRKAEAAKITVIQAAKPLPSTSLTVNPPTASLKPSRTRLPPPPLP